MNRSEIKEIIEREYQDWKTYENALYTLKNLPSRTSIAMGWEKSSFRGTWGPHTLKDRKGRKEYWEGEKKRIEGIYGKENLKDFETFLAYQMKRYPGYFR